MRKYLVRKNFDENNTDPMNAPNRTVFYEKEKKSYEQNTQKLSSEIEEEVEPTASLIQTKKIDSEEDQPLLNTEAKRIFQDSLAALNAADKQRNDIIYMQLESEKKISQELNKKLHANLSKIASAEVDLIKRKNQLEDELHEKTKQLVSSERMAAIGELSGRLAHELRTPLTVIKGSVGVLKLRKGTEIDNFVMERLALMEESVSRMNHQVEKVLNYVQKIPLDKKDVSLKQVLQKSLSLIENPNVTILTPKNDITYNCDSVKMEIIFGNLLLNAVQAIGNESGQIAIELGETEDSIKITIQDSGSGVPDELGERIFEPLVSSKQDGTGLGLSSVKNVVEQHNGKISFTNNPTKFTVVFPKATK
ncbi:HAMP domain-containing sensor histidine kinase [Nitrosopumilus sp.]|uniref:sensor histidine kinase n=1 Tax=Nitrosopumilus sp. TaxID=2024843 RepID=UPI00247D4E05|nr:HAMP domain-containing sensor histidine kinase [Nitrosopumilus sp.]MCV0409355.1 HAMP domain-containing histidine kinase [Nitrosopumilus sp.]